VETNNQVVNQLNESSTALCQVELGKYIPEKLEPGDKIMWEGNEEIEPWVNLTPILKQVEYREREGSNSVSARYSGVCPDGCYTGAGNQKNNRTLRIDVYGGPRASVRGWCTVCMLAGSELADRVIKDVKPEPVKTSAGIDLNTVVPKSIEWLWERRLPLGKFILLDGDPGLAKSILVMDWIARLTTGRGLPDSEKQFGGGAVLVGLEDSIEDTVVPRLIEAKADLSKISVLNTVKGLDKDGKEYEEPFTLQLSTHLDKLREEVVRKCAKLVFIDSLMGVLGMQTNT
jgi:hypothetical protein